MSNIDKNDFVKIVTNIKNEIELTRTRVARQVNSELVQMYFRIGKILYDNSIDDAHFIESVAAEINLEYPGIKGFSADNMRRMRVFYEAYKDSEKSAQLVPKIAWGHNIIILSKIKDPVVREVYIKAAIDGNWSRSTLERQIATEYHKRMLSPKTIVRRSG